MSKTQTAKLWTYITECVRLLYWVYFKPYTLERWLRDIHPELKPDTNPFSKRTEFSTNPRLRRYAGQVWWITALVPWLIVILIAPIYTLISHEAFPWFIPSLFLVGWIIGLMLVAFPQQRLKILLLVVAGFLTALAYDSLGVAYGVAYGVGLAVAESVNLAVVGLAVGLGVALAVVALAVVALGVGCGVALAVVALGVVFGVGLAVDLGVGCGVALGVAYGVGCGVALGVAFGVAGGVACILGALRFYFWLPEFLWMLILYFVLSRHRDGGKWLGYLPPRFDEKIILLLPFIDKLIIKAYRESPSVARETIDYLINSTNQQKVAAQAMAGITIDNLSRCQTLGDIAEIPNQLNWIPSPAPKELGNALPQLLDISQDVKAAVAATSPSRQTELLNRPISALRKLQNSLTFEQNPQLATGYRQITDPWLAILETAQRTLQEKAQQRQEIIQVYIAGNALDPETAEHRFKGRIDIFREIETLSLADQPPVLLLYGGRRAGKTSALKYLPYKVDSTLVPLLVDLQGAASATTLSGLAENLATQIIETARRLPQRLDLPYPKEIKTDPFIALQNWLGEIERTYPSKRFLLNLDEFERLSEVVEATGSRVPLNFLRNVLQHRRQWTLLFSGSHEVAELPSYWNDYLINTRTIRVSFLDEESARELILEPVENFPTIYTPEAVNEIIKLTRCQPYLVQLMCYEVIELLNRDIRENKRELEAICRDAKFRVSITDVQAVIPTVLERGDQYFRELWTSLQKSDQNFLRRLIQGKTPTAQDKGIWKSLQENEQNFLRRLIQGQIPTAQDQGIVKKLIRKEIVTPEGNALQIPLVQRFIKQVLEETNN